MVHFMIRRFPHKWKLGAALVFLIIFSKFGAMWNLKIPELPKPYFYSEDDSNTVCKKIMILHFFYGRQSLNIRGISTVTKMRMTDL